MKATNYELGSGLIININGAISGGHLPLGEIESNAEKTRRKLRKKV